MADTANSESSVFSLGDPDVTARCPATGRLYEVGSGALSHEQQSENFIRQATASGDRPREGERCAQTGREFECGSGALPKTAQTRRFLSELPPEQQAARKAAFEALVAAEPAGQA
jgi:hypothetical protein